MSAFTPFNRSESIGEDTAVIVCSTAPTNDEAVDEIEAWARGHGCERGGERTLNVRRNLNGSRYYYSVCYRVGEARTDEGRKGALDASRRRDKNLPVTSAAMMREKTVERGTQLYERDIRQRVEANNQGKYVSVDITSGDYEVGDDSRETAERIQRRYPAAIVYSLRIGHPAAVNMRRCIERGQP